MSNQLEREKVAELCHEQWSHWMKYLFSKCEKEFYSTIDVSETVPAEKEGFKLYIPNWAVDRWMRQMNTPYKDLSEVEKDSDRNEADKFIELMRGNNG